MTSVVIDKKLQKLLQVIQIRWNNILSHSVADIHLGFYWPVARTAQFLSGASTKATPDRIEGSLDIRLKGHDMYRSGPISSKKGNQS